MARSLSGTGQYFTGSTAPVTAVPLTIACWAKMTSVSGRLVSICDSTSTAERFCIDGGAGIGVRAFVTHSSSSTALASSSTTITSGVWFHACGVFTSAILRAAYLNGGGKITNTTSSTPASLTKMSVGADANGTVLATGSVAYAAIWNIAFSDSDVSILASGASPRLVHPEALVRYWRLTGGSSPEPDFVSATSLTLTGSPAEVVNPVIFLP